MSDLQTVVVQPLSPEARQFWGLPTEASPEMNDALSAKLTETMFADFQAKLEEALLKMQSGEVTEEFKDQVAEQLGQYYSALFAQRQQSPTVEIRKTGDDGSLLIDVTMPIDFIPRDYLIEEHNYLLLHVRKGKLARALKLLPENTLNKRALANSALRGWYVHSHKGKPRRRHRLNKVMWVINTGPTYKLRAPLN